MSLLVSGDEIDIFYFRNRHVPKTTTHFRIFLPAITHSFYGVELREVRRNFYATVVGHSHIDGVVRVTENGVRETKLT